MPTIEQQLVELQNNNADVVNRASDLIDTIENETDRIKDAVNQATTSVPDAVVAAFEKRTVTVSKGDDVNGIDIFGSINDAVNSVPISGHVVINLNYSNVREVYEIDETIDIGNRNVQLRGGYSGMEEDGYLPATIKPLAFADEGVALTKMLGRIIGGSGGQIYFLYVKIELPRQIAGTTLDPGTEGTFIGGDLSVKIHCYSLTGPHTYVEPGNTNPVLLVSTSARGNKGSLQELLMSHCHIETDNVSPLIDIQYSSSTLRFSAYSTLFSDQSGDPVKLREIFSGLTYGTHGYATNLLAAATITQQSV